MTATALDVLPVRRLRPAGLPSPAQPCPPPVPLPRTSVSQPWDRVRFAGPTTARPTEEDAARDLVLVSSPPALALLPGVPREDPAAWCGSLVRAAVEALTGSRPTAQLARWLTADIYESIARRAGLAVRIKGRPTLVRQAVVRRVHLCPISAYAAEASVVVHDGERVRAAAIRIEAHRGRWRATALEIG